MKEFNKVLKIDPENKEAVNGLKKVQKGQDTTTAKAPREGAPGKTSSKGLRYALAALLILVVGAGGWYYLDKLSKTSKEELVGPASAARELMLSSKSAAEEANTETWAEATFGFALDAEQRAKKEFEEENFLAAKETFTEAGNLFQKSIKEAETNSEAAAASADLGSLKEMVASVRINMLKEKSAAEKARAPKMAKKIFNSALAKEKKGEQASKTESRNSLLVSRNAFLGAKAEYKNARLKARAAATLKRDSQTAKTAMAKTKRQVPKTEGTTNDSYQRAIVLESTGTKQSNDGDYTNAKKSFQQAKRFYAQANKEILKQRADDEKQSMLQTKSQIT
ncbi:hypothetical protein IH785_07825, partial [candidate division KSB1 bacterium]|nr:hypothetical protein [candidate division KSB1 bacterium]